MARSSCIYVVTNDYPEIVRAFTVKHELITWLSRHIHADDYHVWRAGDGLYTQKSPVEITEEVLALAANAAH